MRVGHKQPRRECGIIRTVMLTKALLIKDLHKTSGALIAVDNISFDVGHNEIVGLLGPGCILPDVDKMLDDCC